ncbi:ParB/RepB/Spo0J family partition protein [Novosphingopyxis sp.]|uniref:ParB/RepB/Spo0J family partition protein n=1 Tax=Novosphingopyxis sp. TaxID=2709690 RepID=UPI003B5A6A91
MTTINTINTTTIDISLAKLIPSPANVRRTGAGAGIEALAASIQAHGLLQSLVVRPKPGSSGQATDRYEVVAGARRLAALKLLAKQKRITKGTAIPCRVLDADGVDGSEASLAENVVRVDMHPADQFEAFHGLHDGGAGIEDIAARFGVSAHTVRQRLRLAVVSPALIQAYRDEALTLDHLTAFTVTEDQEAQERVFGQLQAWQRNPDTIRRLLTHALVPATDRRAIFIGLDAYAAAGGTVQRDLFSEDRGGWIADPALLERLVAEHMEATAEAIRAEGWRWVAIGQEAQAAAWNMRRVWPSKVALSLEDEQRRDELASRYDELAEQHNRSGEDLPEDVAAELDRIDAELAALGDKQDVFRPEDVARAGVVVTLAADGSLRIERGYVRPEDEAQPEPVTPDEDGGEGDGTGETGTDEEVGETPIGGTVTPIRGEAEPEDKAPALSAALLAELEAHRTAGLQAAIAGQPELAFRVILHGLATDAFYQRYGETVASFHAYPPALASACPDIADSTARQAMAAAEDSWRTRLPQDHGALWEWLQDQDATALLGLLAVCVARTAHAGGRTWTGAEGSRCIAAQVATAAGLDMRQCWTATKESYLGRVQKALILDAVREGAGAGVARRIAHAKKEVMVADAAQVLDGKGWLPAVLRVPGTTPTVDSTDASASTPIPMAAE